MQIHTHVHGCLHICIHKYIQMHTDMLRCIYMRMHTQMYTCTCKCSHEYTNAHIHIQNWKGTLQNTNTVLDKQFIYGWFLSFLFHLIIFINNNCLEQVYLHSLIKTIHSYIYISYFGKYRHAYSWGVYTRYYNASVSCHNTNILTNENHNEIRSKVMGPC